MKPVSYQKRAAVPSVTCENERGIKHLYRKIGNKWICPGMPPVDKKFARKLDKYAKEHEK